MPTRSSGCYTCRKRKIRCDETQPHCKKCATHGVPCPGYRSDKPDRIEFKDLTQDTVVRARGQYKAKEARKTSATSSISTLPFVFVDSPFDLVESGYASSAYDASSPESLSLAVTDRPLSTLVFPPNLLSPVVNRQSMYGAFLDVYMPKAPGGGLDHFELFETIAAMPTTLPALEEGLQALSLVSVGSVNKDEVLLRESSARYGKALASLGKTLAREETFRQDEVLAAVTVLATAALYDHINQGDTAWYKHVQGSLQLIAARGAESITSELGLLLYANARHAALVQTLIARKAPLMAQPQFRILAFKVPVPDSSTGFYDVAIQIPGLLEQHDILVCEPSIIPTTEDIDALLGQCALIESDLRDWYVDWQARSLLQGSEIFDELPIECFTTFTSLCADHTFETAYMFRNFPTAYLTSLYWMCMHFLRTSIQSLYRMRTKVTGDWDFDTDLIVPESELLGYCLDLCKCFPFFCEPMSSSTGHVGMFLPARTAALYFKAEGHWQYMMWLQAVRTTVFNRGMSPPNIRDTTKSLLKQEVAAGMACEHVHCNCRLSQSPSGFSNTSSPSAS